MGKPAPAPAVSLPVPAPVPNGFIQERRAKPFQPGRGGETAFETGFETPRPLIKQRNRRAFHGFTATRPRKHVCTRARAHVRTTIYNFETRETLNLNGGLPPFFGFAARFIAAAALETNKIGGGNG
ncbi:MAG TPA: hypothetical protein VGB70_12785 [Allosphingosinicella sp.]